MFDLVSDLEQKQTLSARQLQSLQILSYTNQELENFMTDEYLENPMLDNSVDKQDEMIKDLEQLYEKGTSYKDHYLQWEDEDSDRKSDLPAREPDEIYGYIMGQLHRKDYSDDEWTLMGYLVQCLDEKGFFDHDLDVVARALGRGTEIIERCLERLKELEPVGIFSRDISECLIRQLEAAGNTDEKLIRLIRYHLDDVLKGQISSVSRDLHLSTARIKEYIHMIGQLDPRPIMNMPGTHTEYIIPDILVSREKEEWRISLNDSWMGEYKCNGHYIRMMQDTQDPELRAYFQQKLERARYVINCVEQRRSTIVKVVGVILELQEGYFLQEGGLTPMSMEQVAARAGIHTSTVSRAIKGKYLQYKRSVLLKDLFTASLTSQEDVSADRMKKQIAKIIQEEDGAHPLSDQKISEIIREDGIVLSRRTVAKYRMELGIPDSRLRRYL